jgi:tetratricopeptide (TPR) repeat protein
MAPSVDGHGAAFMTSTITSAGTGATVKVNGSIEETGSALATANESASPSGNDGKDSSGNDVAGASDITDGNTEAHVQSRVGKDPWAPRGLFRGMNNHPGCGAVAKQTNTSTSAAGSLAKLNGTDTPTTTTTSEADSSRMEFVNRIVQAHNAIVARGRERGRDAYDDRDDWEMTAQDFNLQFADFQYNYNSSSTQSPDDDVLAVGNGIGEDVHDETQPLTGTGTDVSIRQGSILGPEESSRNERVSILPSSGGQHTSTLAVHYYQDDLSLPLRRRQNGAEILHRPDHAQRRTISPTGPVSPLSAIKKKKQALYFDEGMQWCQSIANIAPHVHVDDHAHQDESCGCSVIGSCYDEFGKLRTSCQHHSKMMLATFHYNLGKCQEMQGQISTMSDDIQHLHFTSAHAYYRDALQALEGDDDCAAESDGGMALCGSSPKVMTPLKMCVYISMAQVTFQQKKYHAAFQHFQAACRIAQVMNKCAKKHDLAMAALLNGLGVSSYYSTTSSPVNDADEEEGEVAPREHGGHGELLNLNTPSMSASVQWLQRALLIRRHHLWATPDSHLEVATVLNNLGRVHHQLGHYDQAKACYSESLCLRKFLLGSFHLDVGATMFNLGELERLEWENYNDNGTAVKARAMHQGFLTIVKQVAQHQQNKMDALINGAGNHDQLSKMPVELNQMRTMSNMYLADFEFVCQNFSQAAELYTRAINASNKASDSPSAVQQQHQQSQITIILWNKLGHCWFELGEWKEALQAYGLGFEQEEEVMFAHGLVSPLEQEPNSSSQNRDFEEDFLENRLVVLHQMASPHMYLADKVAEEERCHFGDYAVYDDGRHYYLDDDSDSAQEYKSALKRYQQVFLFQQLQLQQQHRRSSKSNNIEDDAQLVEEMINTLLCMALVNLKLCKANNQNHHIGVSKALQCIGKADHMYIRCGDLFASQSYVACFRSRVGAMLARAAVQQRDDLVLFDFLARLAFQEVVDSNRSLQSLARNATEMQSEAVVSNLCHLSLLSRQRENFKQALEYLVQSENWQIHFWGTDAISLIETRFQIAGLHCDTGDLTLARDVYETVLQAQRSAFCGEEHEDVIRTKSKMAELYCEAGDLDLALEEYESVLQLQQIMFGSTNASHGDVADTHLSIADVYRRQGNGVDMLLCFDDAVLESFDDAVPMNQELDIPMPSIFPRNIRWYKLRLKFPRHAVAA